MKHTPGSKGRAAFQRAGRRVSELKTLLKLPIARRAKVARRGQGFADLELLQDERTASDVIDIAVREHQRAQPIESLRPQERLQDELGRIPIPTVNEQVVSRSRRVKANGFAAAQ